MNADSALRELVGKAVDQLRKESKSRGDKPGGWWQGYSEACHTAANMFTDILAAPESILAAPQAAETPFAYFIDGPGGFWTCYRKDEIEPQIQEHCKANGEDAEDYTATAMYVHPAAQQSATQAAPAGMVMVEQSVVPTYAIAKGVWALNFARKQGYDDETTVNLVFTEMLLIAGAAAIEADDVPDPATNWADADAADYPGAVIEQEQRA